MDIPDIPDVPVWLDSQRIPDEPEAELQDEDGEVHLVYKIEGRPNEVPVFELARTLQAVGTIIQEANRVVRTQPNEMVVKVRPFEKGSFFMDLVVLESTEFQPVSQP